MAGIDLRAAINAVSDVVQNRPRPIREFDQIYMKTGDMVMQSDLIARWARGKSLAFIGDGDSIALCIAYLMKEKIIAEGPSKIVVYDFDERIVNAITRFSEAEGLEILSAKLYNCLDRFPDCSDFGCFYTNPPWGASNGGESVKVFVQRGMEAVGYNGAGTIVIADDEELEWAKFVLASVQTFSLESGFYVERMIPRLHAYHLDDAPDLKSCNLVIRALPNASAPAGSSDITDSTRLENFYGRENIPRVKYVRELKSLNYGRARDQEYQLELLGEKK